MRSPPSRARSLLRLKVPRRRRTCGRSRSTCCSSSVSSRSNTSSSHWASRCSRRRSCSACDRCSRAARVSSSSRLRSSCDSKGGGISPVRTLASAPLSAPRSPWRHYPASLSNPVIPTPPTFSLARSSSKRPWISRFQPSCMEWKESRGISRRTCASSASNCCRMEAKSGLRWGSCAQQSGDTSEGGTE